ncbi:hypothetical protein VD0004_g7924 [Verticillium dahliae]|nr:Protein SYM1 [Verticillium dahliae VDG1]PNH38949.1 hypothetical protein VD0004_g7924 [Verticillium dahliae]PNH62339.1 hypothetical protein VD0001_g9469 [Verticillium dahliae]RBQ68605.1 hypothetical protein VDGD_00103 [Verticillium dahliae]
MPVSAPSWTARLYVESGAASLVRSPRDTKILCLQRFVRYFGYGATFLILVHFLSSHGFSEERIGIFMTLTLFGDVIISFILTAVTDKLGRRRVLAAGAVLMATSGFMFALSGNYWLLLVASVIGVISPSGNEIGPFRAVEESILAQLTDREDRSDIFAWSTLLGTAGAAAGTMTCGWLVQLLQDLEHWDTQAAYRVIFVIYACIGIVKLFLVFFLSAGVEAEPSQAAYSAVPTELQEEDEEGAAFLADDQSDDGHDGVVSSAAASRRRSTSMSMSSQRTLTAWQRIRNMVPVISAQSRSLLYRLLVVFFVDSFASGMASPSWLTYFFTTVHSLEPGSLGTLFLVTNILASLSNLAALPIIRRLGPLKTMVFTHLPSAVFLAVIPFVPAGSTGTWVAMGLLSLRACSQSMDTAPRQAFLSAVVLPGERTAILGVVNSVKTLAQAGGVGTSGFLAARKLWVVVLTGAGTMKVMYDLSMLWMFWRLKERGDTTESKHTTDEEEQ